MSQTELFGGARDSAWEAVEGGDEQIWLRRAFLPHAEATDLFEQLRAEVPWRQDDLDMFGKTYAIPRLHQWYGDTRYTWSGIEMRPLAWPPILEGLRQRVERATRRRFNSALANYYRDGDDTVGWHADDEPELGPAPFIASVSLGAERDFALRRNTPATDAKGAASGAGPRLTIALPHGSLLVMTEGVQSSWQHALPRRKRVRAGRINLTFRQMLR